MLHKLSQDLVKQFSEAHGQDFTKHHVMYDAFFYKAASWSKHEQVVCRVERVPNDLIPRATFIITTLMVDPKPIVKAYYKCGNMENFIKESNIDFFISSVSHTLFVVNAVKHVVKRVSYNLINIMKRLVMLRIKTGYGSSRFD